MSVGPFTVEVLVVFCATVGILHYYGNIRKQHFLVTLAVFISWFFSLLIIFILPIDVSNTCYNDCLKIPQNLTKCEKPWSYMPSYVLPQLWRVIYWSSQILSWILLPIMQSYVCAGAFTVWGKLKTAIIENALWYGSYLVIFGALLVYVALKPDLNINAENLKLIGITASNTWGLLLLVILLGYGLVDLPRTAWNKSKPALRLDISLFKVSKLSTEKEDADEDLARVLGEVKKASEEIRYNSELRKYIDIIISKCPEGSLNLFSKGTDDFVDFNRSNTDTITIKTLTKLHKNVMTMTHRATRTLFQWNAELKLAFYLEDTLKAESSKDRIFKSSFSEQTPRSRLSLKLKWYWEIILKPGLFKLLSVVLLILSVSLVWSEATFFSTKPTLSIFAILIDVANKEYLYLSVEFISCLTIAYMCACTYYTIFKVKFLNFYYFAPNQQTDPNSLLFSGLLLCRLTYAICLNFLAMIHLDGHITGSHTEKGKPISETDFTRFMGHMDLLSFISKGFNVYYPIVVLLVCFCTYFSLGKRLLHCIGVEQFISDDDISADYIREGREITKREKRKIERDIKGKNWSERSQKMRDKYGNLGRNFEVQKIDCSDDDELLSTRVEDDPKMKLSSGGRKKYKTLDDDKVKLLSDVDYAPVDSPRRNVRSYENIGNNLSSAPRNIFDDA